MGTNEAVEGVTLFTDGGCIGNPGPGGWGVIRLEGGRYEEAVESYMVVADQVAQAIPDAVCAVGEWQLHQGTALAPNIAKVDAAGLLPDQAPLQQDHGEPALTKKERGRRTHDAAADHNDVGRP